MFRRLVTSTALTSQYANMDPILGRIGHAEEDGSRDVSLVATLRGLLWNKIGEEDVVTVETVSESSITKRTLRDNSGRAVVRSITEYQPIVEKKNVFQIFSLEGGSEDNIAAIDVIDVEFPKLYSGWAKEVRVSDLFIKNFRTSVFINNELHNVAIFIDNLTTRKLHHLQCAVFGMFPWFYDPKRGVSAIDMELAKSLTETSPDHYLDVIKKISGNFDFRTGRIKHLLDGFERKLDEEDLRRTEGRDREIRNELDNLNSRMGSYLEELRKVGLKILGLKQSLSGAGSDSGIMEFFLANKQSVVESVDGSEITFGVMGNLEYFDEDMAERFIENGNSVFYQYGNSDISKDDVAALMKAVFIDDEIKIRFCAAYRFRIDGTVRGMDHFEYSSDYDGYTPNPHIDAYHCLGNHQRHIESALRERNYIGAISQAIASCKSLNLGDGVVMDEFMKRIAGGRDCVNMKCFELPDGSVVTPIDAVKYLKSKEAQGE